MPITWNGNFFNYTGSITQGTSIYFGQNNPPVKVTTDEYKRLLDHFRGRTVRLGASRTNPPPGSLGDWLMENVTGTAIASYVGPILEKEEYATHFRRGNGFEIKFLN